MQNMTFTAVETRTEGLVGVCRDCKTLAIIRNGLCADCKAVKRVSAIKQVTIDSIELSYADCES